MEPHKLPPNIYFDDPSTLPSSESQVQTLAFTFASETLIRVFDWIAQGDINQRSLRLHLVILCVAPQLLPCKYPSARWCAHEHGVSRQWASRLQQEFTRSLGGQIQFRGQRFRSRSKRRSLSI